MRWLLAGCFLRRRRVWPPQLVQSLVKVGHFFDAAKFRVQHNCLDTVHVLEDKGAYFSVTFCLPQRVQVQNQLSTIIFNSVSMDGVSVQKGRGAYCFMTIS